MSTTSQQISTSNDKDDCRKRRRPQWIEDAIKEEREAEQDAEDLLTDDSDEEEDISEHESDREFIDERSTESIEREADALWSEEDEAEFTECESDSC